MLKTDIIQLYWNFHASVFNIVLRYRTPKCTMMYSTHILYPCTIF